MCLPNRMHPKKKCCGFNAIPHARAGEYIIYIYIMCEVNFTIFYVCMFTMLANLLCYIMIQICLQCVFYQAPVAPQVLQVPNETMVVKKEPVVSRKKAGVGEGCEIQLGFL